MEAGLTAPWGRPAGWPRLRRRLLHLYFVLRRPVTFGVRGLVYDRRQDRILLIRHTYVPGWQLPGGGVEAGESAVEALARELREEANVTLGAPPVLKSLHFNRNGSRRDHVALYLVEDFVLGAPKMPDREIAEAAFFPLDGLPGETSPATRRRLSEIFGGGPPSPYW